MIIYLLRRVNLLIFTLLILCFASYLLAFLFPGDALTNLTGIAFNDEVQRQIYVEQYRFDQGHIASFFKYLEFLWLGQWGISFTSGESLLEEIGQVMPASIELSAYALILSLFIGIPLGFASALKHNKVTDRAILSVSLIGYSIPVFWLALIFIIIFSLQLNWLPISGRINLLYDIPQETGFILYDVMVADIENKAGAVYDVLEHMLLPTLSISIVTSTIILRITRRSLIEVMESDYIKAAFAKGLNQRQVILKHGFRNAILPIMPQLALQFTTLLTNAMIVETIFSWPGIGNWLIQAIYQGDYPAIRAGMLAVAAAVVIFTVTIDILYQMIDPTKLHTSRVRI